MQDEEVIRLAADLADHVEDILLGSNSKHRSVLFNPQTYLSEERLFEVAKYALRDLSRVERDQDGHVAATKMAGYIAFWFAKLKPLNSVFVADTDENEIEHELTSVNEEVALLLADRTLPEIAYVNAKYAPEPWASCRNEACVFNFRGTAQRGHCYKLKNQKFLEAHKHRHRNYMIYALRFRSQGPYFIVNYLEQGLFFACSET